MNDELLKRLDILAAKLNSTADQLWHVLLRQARIEAIQDLLVGIAAIFVCRWLVGFSRRMWKKGDDDDGLFYFASVFAMLVCIAIGFLGFWSLYAVPGELLNPGYWALERILQSVK